MRASAREKTTPSRKKSCPRCVPGLAATRNRRRNRDQRRRTMAVGRLTQKKPDPCSFVIFGVTGDLTHRLVIPALYNLAAAGLLPDKFCVVGIARSGMSNDALRDSLMKGLRQFATRPVDDAVAKRLLECVTSIEADPKEPASFDVLRKQLEKLEANRSTGGNRLFYLATPPNAFAPIARQLGRVDLLQEQHGAWR